MKRLTDSMHEQLSSNSASALPIYEGGAECPPPSVVVAKNGTGFLVQWLECPGSPAPLHRAGLLVQLDQLHLCLFHRGQHHGLSTLDRRFCLPQRSPPRAQDFGHEPIRRGQLQLECGDWYVFGGIGSSPNRGAFGPNRSRTLAEFVDELSNTVMASEVKTYQGVLTSCTVASVLEPNQIPSPNADPYTAVPEYTSGCTLKLTAHAEWVDGAALQTGFTTAWPPNKVIKGGSPAVEVDLVGGGRRVVAPPMRRSSPGAITPAA